MMRSQLRPAAADAPAERERAAVRRRLRRIVRAAELREQKRSRAVTVAAAALAPAMLAVWIVPALSFALALAAAAAIDALGGFSALRRPRAGPRQGFHR